MPKLIIRMNFMLDYDEDGKMLEPLAIRTTI